MNSYEYLYKLSDREIQAILIEIYNEIEDTDRYKKVDYLTLQNTYTVKYGYRVALMLRGKKEELMSVDIEKFYTKVLKINKFLK